MASKGKATLNQPYEAFARTLEGHVKSEEKAIALYERLLTLQDPLVSTVVNLILDDERHHHAMLLETALKLGKEYWAKRAVEIGRQIPESAVKWARRDVETLRNGEAIGARELATPAQRYLKSEDIGAQVVTTWAVMDSTKHEALLTLLAEYLGDQVESAQRGREMTETGAM